MDYQVYWITPPVAHRDRLLAEISLRPEVEGIEERQDSFGFYVPQSQAASFSAFIIELQSEVSFPCVNDHIDDQNWNAVWESQFDPVAIDDWAYIRASFHPESTTPYPIELIINPANAFGTGHHETTYLMMSWMRHQTWKGQSVLDFGAGTGILGILAAKLQASSVVGIDIRPEAVESMHANALLNKVEIEAMQGSAEKINKQTFDRVLANVNLDVLLMYAQELMQSVKPAGQLAISGILAGDDRTIRKTFVEVDWQWMEQEGEWITMAGTKQ